MSPTPWVVGNWKQHLLRAPARALATAIAEGLAASPPGPVRVGLAPPYLALDTVHAALDGAGAQVLLLAQDVAAQDEGAFTGEVGAAMVREAGAGGAIVGHSERRALFGDDDALVARKVAHALSSGLTTILCVGEPLAVRRRGGHVDHVLGQLDRALGALPSEIDDGALLVAYEPVWAIGTGETATAAQAADMHREIRAWLARWRPGAGGRSILYGGSVKPGNASDLARAHDVDGFLVGGASLDASAFLAIVRALADART